MEPATTITGGMIVLIVNGVLLWIREWRKHRTWRSNGDDLNEIKKKIDCVDGKVSKANISLAEVITKVNDQKDQCSKTVARFDRAISDQGKEILELAKNRGR